MKWVRPVISLVMAGAVVWGFIKGIIPPQEFLAVAVGCIAWWYYRRDQEKKIGGQ